MTQRTEWFTEARFGLFIHFGAYAQVGRDAWVRNREALSVEDYQPAIDSFHPDAFDPEEWASQAAAAGVRYAVLTAKHHDGFCMFDSKLTDYTIMNNGFGRDIVREFLDAFRAKGIRVGLYYSLLDWHHPHYRVQGDENHPDRDRPECWAGRDFDRYLDYMHGQIEELVTEYGHLDLLWFDFSYQDLVGSAWRGAELIDMVRRHQPHVITNNRMDAGAGGFGSLVTDSPAPWAGDWACPESLVPAGGVQRGDGTPVPWEVAMTHNNSWGWHSEDTAYKPTKMLIRLLAQTVSKGGNLIFNVGPRPDGSFPPQAVKGLAEIGEWLDRNGESIYGAGRAVLPKPEWGWYTAKNDVVYAHVFEPPMGPLALEGVPADRVRSMRLLSDGRALERVQTWLTDGYPDTVFVGFGPVHTATYPLPDDADTVIAIDLAPDPD